MTDNRITALYCRYSFDDGVAGEEHISISHQKSLLTKYAENNGFTNVKYYADDGYGGTSFDRPDFQRMLADVDNGLIGTIIVKDMSRFGRNYILVGQYVEIVLPMKNVRVIGVNDNYDSTNKNNELFQFESILNEMYAADVSKKVRSAKRTIGLSGQTVKSRPVYGYKLKPGTKREWIIDEAVAGIVYMVFDKFVNEEWTEHRIAKYLRDNKVLSTSAYINSKLTPKNNPYKWYTCTIEKMLSMQEYVGDTVNFKTRKVSYKTNDVEFIPREKWLIFPDTHPPIISREMFEKAQVRLNRERNPFPKVIHEYDTYFRKKLVCSECGRILLAYIPPDDKNGVGYNCKEYTAFKSELSHHVREDDLRLRFKDQIMKFQTAYITAPDEIEEKLGISQISNMKSNIKTMNERISEIKVFMQALFESKINGDISEDDFRKMSQNYNTEISELQEKLADTTVKYNRIKDNSERIVSSLEYIGETDFSEITEEMCNRLIEKVVIGPYTCNQKKYENFQQTDFYIYGIGKIGEFVDIAPKTMAEKLRDLIPELIREGKCNCSEATRRLGIGKGMLKKILERENTGFRDEVVAYKKKVILESIKNGLSLNEIYPLADMKKYVDVCNFLFRHYGIGYREMRNRLMSGEIIE